jgi:amino acid adenylation domain-containing protein/non-ribosomal peptide synthase protein (TIGR01720 family)
MMRNEQMGEDAFVFPMSFAQERFWFLGQLDPDSAAYNLAAALRIEGPLDADLVGRCVAEIVRRHEALRTTFGVVDGEPSQIVRDGVVPRVERLDLTGLPPALREVELSRLLAREARRPFDLEAGPLLRALLLRVSPTDHALLWVVHHGVFDGLSTLLVAREFAALYGAFSAGRSSPLEDPPLQYADFAHWQRERAKAGLHAAQLDYWVKRLAGPDAVLELPADRPRPAVQRSRGAKLEVRLADGLAGGLAALARREQTTLYAVLAAGFKALLARYTGATDMRVGTPVTNRSRADLERLVGCFANTVVLRTDLGGDPTFSELLARVGQVVREAQANQEVPFERVVEALRPARDLSRAPLCQVFFALQPAARGALAMPGFAISLLDVDTGGAQFDLALELAEGEGGLAGTFEYDTDLFDASTVERLRAHFVALLESAVANPAARLSELSMLSPPERAALLARGQGPAGPNAPTAAHRRFEARARLAPSSVAVVDGHATITYGDLSRRVRGLARALRRRGVGPEVRVGVCLPRSLDMIVAVLGVLEAGGAYVPIDPDHPAERRAALAADAGALVVLTEGDVLLRAENSAVAETSSDLEAWAEALPEQAAYVLYTSGSTGRPKGVVVPHRALSRFVDAATSLYELTPGDRVLQFASLSFDASVEEIFSCLASGATLVLRSEGMLASPAEFLRACGEWGVTVLDLPTMYWHRVVAGLVEGLALPASVRLVIIGGEAALPERVGDWHASVGARVRLVNTYGPTEATVVATSAELASAPAGRGVPIGRPIVGAEAFVLDAALQPVPEGVVGDLYLGGEGVSRGYWGRPGLTAERFVPNPFATRAGAPLSGAGARLYRTGDRARLRVDGQLEFVGRADHQVKLRGMRIEPGEIEARLAELPGVREAVVVLREDPPQGPRLVAYVAADAGVEPEPLRRALRERLPDHMTPSAFVVLPALPHTAQGKIDRRALPPPPEAVAEAVEPATQAEATLAAIWAELLKRERVGVRDNFFELGGDSILALQVVSRARAAGIAIKPRQLFQHQTVAELAAVVTRASAPEASAPLAGDVPLTPIQRWFFEQGAPNPHHWNQSVLLELRQPIAFETLSAAIAAIAEHHDALRLRFTPEAGGFRQHYVACPGVAVVRVDLSNTPADGLAEAIRCAADECQSRLNVSEGPLLRALLIELGPARPARLLLAAHHLVVDGVSWRILLEDLATACRQHAAGEPIALAAKTVAFGDWARRKWAYAPSEEAALRARASADTERRGAPLPVDDPAGSELEGDTVRLTQELDVDATWAMLHALPAYRLRVDEIVLAALAETLTRWAGEEALLVELEGHGRDALPDVDVSRTVGWFTSLYPVLLEVPADTSPDRMLKAVKERLREASQGALMRAQHPARVSFNYLGQLDAPLDSGSLFAFDPEGAGAERDPRAPRGYELEIDSSLVHGRLRVTWGCSGARYRPETMRRLSEAFRVALHRLIHHCVVPEVGGYTPSDFALARLGQADLDRVLKPFGDVEDVYSLSPLQQGLLFHSLWQPGSGVYVEQVSCRLGGAFDVDAFRRAWQLMVERHGALRTTFAWEGAAEPLQIVRRKADLAFDVEDWREVDAAGQKARTDALFEADRARGFDLTLGPLTRLTLVRLRDDEHLVLWSHHHLILDGWSAALVLRDALAAYEALRGGRPVALPPGGGCYRDYVAWLLEQDQSAAEAFFRQKLAGFSAATPLPLERGPELRAEQAAGAGGHGAASVVLPAAVTERLQRFVRQHRLTLSALVQGAWALVLSRTAASDDVVFGITVAGRSAPMADVEAMVGLFINTLPLRVSAPPSAAVVPWLRDLLAATTELGPHEHLPLSRARALSAIAAGRPLFESLLVFENYPADPRIREGLPGLAVRDVTFADQTNYPLTLAALPGPELGLRLSYDRQRFDEESASRLLGLVETALRQLTSRPDARLGELCLLSEREARRITIDWNATERAYGDRGLVHEQFEAQAARDPQQLAVLFDEQRVTYGELNARANRLAHALRRRGVGPDVLVAVCAERSVELVVALLAVLKAGGAYVPLDPDYPPERLADVLDDSGARVVLGPWPLCARLPAHGAAVLCWDADRAMIEREPTTDPAVALDPDHLFYTLYTSGSTGRPKGAGNTHRGLRNRLLWMQARYGLVAGERVLHKTPFGFDVSAWELFWPLMIGATMVVARPGDHRDGERLAALIGRHGVSTVHFVPPMLEAFLETPGLDACGALRRVICSGEALPAGLVERFFARLGAVELHNLYGPTEASIDVTAWACEPGATSVPIGRPIANTQVYVLDRQGQPLPAGAAGELYLGGVGLARGYHRRPGLTAERFVPDPFGPPGARLYRTGDRARHRADGAIEYLGRFDHQIKLRGQRIELGEIEARLGEHPAVREAVAVVRDEAHGGKRLVAYVTAREGASVEAEALRAWLGRTLPPAMVPSSFRVLAALPLSPNGKIDRKALPAPEAAAAGRPYKAPRTQAERILAAIWAEVLRHERVGVDDDFFELGGDSIVTLQIIARAAQRGLRLSPKVIFEHPTVAEAAVRAETSAEPEPPEPPPAAAPDADLSPEEWRDLLDELDR